jgi:hypothetical protein
MTTEKLRENVLEKATAKFASQFNSLAACLVDNDCKTISGEQRDVLIQCLSFDMAYGALVEYPV